MWIVRLAEGNTMCWKILWLRRDKTGNLVAETELNQSQFCQVEAFEETGEFPSDVEFVELETDVGWYGRQCRKRIRDQVRRLFGINKMFLLHNNASYLLLSHTTTLENTRLTLKIGKDTNMSWAESL